MGDPSELGGFVDGLAVDPEQVGDLARVEHDRSLLDREGLGREGLATCSSHASILAGLVEFD